MKLKLLVTLAATTILALPSAFAAPKLPEFQTKTQLHALRAEQDAVRESIAAAEQHVNLSSPVFYTGKIADMATGKYKFKFRDYDPQTSRWMSIDPAGYLDGPNNGRYAPIPTFAIDYQGLYAIIILTRVYREDCTWYYNGTLNETLNPGQRAFTANTGTNNESTTEGNQYGRSGPLPPGTYNLLPRADWAEGDTYGNGTPAITGAGQNPGSINSGGIMRNNLYVHGPGVSDGCVATNFVNQITQAMNDNINYGGTEIRIIDNGNPYTCE